ncbi:MAG: FixH family protein [Gemmatimonadetes bacterium]|nr:FixH family protein [Gemmatimonadota bacterium]
MSKRGWYWPWLLATGLLGIVAVNVTMLFVANSDANGSVVEPDYYRKAVQWESTMTHRAASDLLRWSATVSLSATDTVNGATSRAATLRVTLADSAGAGVAGAVVRAVLIHNADAGRPLEVALREDGAGRYGAELPVAHGGLWEVRVNADRGAERFAVIAHTDLVVTPAAR